MTDNVTGVPHEHDLSEVSHPKRKSLLTRLKIAHRVYLGFGLLLVMLVGLSTASYFSLVDVETEIGASEKMNSDALLVSDIRQGIDEIQNAARKYFEQKDEDSKALYSTSHQRLSANVKELLARVQGKDDVKAVVNTIAHQVDSFDSGFTQIAELMNERDQLYDRELASLGSMIDRWISKIGEKASVNGNFKAVTSASTVQQNLTSVRLEAAAYHYSHDLSHSEKALVKFSLLENRIKILDKSLKNPSQRETLKMVLKLVPNYKENLQKQQTLVTEIERLDNEVLIAEAQKIAATSEQIRSLAIRDTAAISDSLNQGVDQAKTTLLIVGIVALLFGMIAALVISRSIANPVVKLTDAMSSLADGDLATEIEGTDRGDEIGEMANALGIFKQNALRTKELEAKQEQQKQLAEQEKHEMMVQMADDFDSHVGVIVEAVSSASSQLHVTAQSMSEVSKTTAEQATAASAASVQTSSNVQTVASATEEMTTTIGEISQQVGLAAQSAQEAVGKVTETNSQMQMLSDTANKIGEVVELISGIAEQTNLLALNATIEAARAGDSGKGFAVVAGEVKALAGQTANATNEISQQISAIQSATQQASSSMDDVNRVILQVNEISTAIAAAMEEQNAATHEIANNITQAAQGTQLVNDNVAAVTDATAKTGLASGDVISAALDLQGQAGTLKEEVSKFITQVRAS